MQKPKAPFSLDKRRTKKKNRFQLLLAHAAAVFAGQAASWRDRSIDQVGTSILRQFRRPWPPV